MRNPMRKPLFLATAIMACFASGVFAETATLQFVNANANYAMGGVYTSPYTISVNGTSTLLICDDFATDVHLGSSWTANVTYLSDILSAAPTDGVRFDTGSGSAQISDYVTAAVLAAQLMATNPATVQAGEISYAIWSIFDTSPLYASIQTAANTNTSASTGYGSLTAAQSSAIVGYVNSARAIADLALASGNFSGISNLVIYTPITPPGPNSQEFIGLSTRPISMPEPSSPAILAIDLLGVAGLFLFIRRRVSVTN